MRIGILTQPFYWNYGGIIQCFALQTVLQRMGHEVVILDRKFAYPSLGMVMLRLGSVVKCFVRRYFFGNRSIRPSNPFSPFYYIYKYPIIDNTAIKDFIHPHFKFTPSTTSSHTLKKYVLNHELDCIVVGSDQVWRECYSPCITDYFLGFLPSGCKVRKIAYAASFGVQDSPISARWLDECIRLAGRFDALSVREDSGVTLMQEVFGLQAKRVLDPTMLLEREDYRLLVSKEDKAAASTGVLAYILDKTPEKKQIMDDVAGKLQLPCQSFIPDAEKVCVLPSVGQWLAAFDRAGFVITDSFHGCVFSILFRKNFIVILNKDRGADRFHSLLKQFGLQNRLISGYGDLEKRAGELFKPIDYAAVEEKLSRLKADSLRFLREALTK